VSYARWQTPYFDFEWQRTYRYDAALAEQGLDAPVDVFLGEQTLDEMCLGVVGFATPI
jgi:hypothetical protein